MTWDDWVLYGAFGYLAVFCAVAVWVVVCDALRDAPDSTEPLLKRRT